MKNVDLTFNRPSRFISEIPRYLMKQTYGAILKDTPSYPDTELQERLTHHTASSQATSFSGDKKNPFANNPYIQKGFGSSTKEPDYKAGDRVTHFKFGSGTITSMSKLANDYEVVVLFDNFGQRKLRSSFAKLVREK